MDFLSLNGFPGKLIDLGRVASFKSRITRLNKRIKGRKYRFKKMSEGEEGNFWLFEAEDDEEILGAVVKVQDGRVYAISEDVLNLVESEFARRQGFVLTFRCPLHILNCAYLSNLFMTVKVSKSSKESFERFMSRFDGMVQRARIVRLLRERKHRKKDPTKRQVRQAALKREEYRAKREKMKFY
jgi:hypothetical protein